MQNDGGLRTLSLPNDGVAKKRKRLSGDERLNRNRERNRIHARRTRERKKTQSVSLQNRINELNEEGIKLRQLIDERYTASSLLGLSQLGMTGDHKESSNMMLPSSSICRNYYADTLFENGWSKDGCNASDQVPASTPKRVRRSGKYSQQERDRIRRERNRMHAKKTRDRKKQFLEMSENIIAEMEVEAKAMRSYLLSLNLISEEDCALSLQRERESKEEIAKLKKSAVGEEDAADYEDDEDDASSSSDSLQDDNQPDREARSQSSSDDNEKVSSWSGSSDGNSNHNSSGTSRNTNSSSSRSATASDGTMKLTTLSLSGTGNTDKASDASISANHDKRSDSGITNSSGDDPDRDSPEDAKSMGLDWGSGDEYRVRAFPANSAPESYHHGKAPKTSASLPS